MESAEVEWHGAARCQDGRGDGVGKENMNPIEGHHKIWLVLWQGLTRALHGCESGVQHCRRQRRLCGSQHAHCCPPEWLLHTQQDRHDAQATAIRKLYTNMSRALERSDIA